MSADACPGNKTGDAAYWNHTMNVLGPAVRSFLTEAEACSQRHCSGHGRCVDYEGNGVRCACVEGWRGADCKEKA